MSTPLTPLPGVDVYVPGVTDDGYEAKVAAARESVQRKRDLAAALEEADAAQVDAVTAALAAAPENISDNEVARQIGLFPSTFRSITAELRKARRRARDR